MVYLRDDIIVSKRTGKKAIVKKQTFDGTVHAVMLDTRLPVELTPSTVRRWWRRVDKFTDAEAVKPARKNTPPPLPKGEKGIGVELHNKFRAYVKSNIPIGDEFRVIYKMPSKTYMYKLNGKTMFECTESSYRLSVLAHPKHLPQSVLQQAFFVYPKEYNWSLSARFIFTDLSQLPLLKSVAQSGIYGRTSRK